MLVFLQYQFYNPPETHVILTVMVDILIANNGPIASGKECWIFINIDSRYE
jgi:hypothetical protein